MRGNATSSAEAKEVKVSEDLKSAYTLIREYKEGTIQPGSPMTEEQQRLILLLAEDLSVDIHGSDIGAVAALAARADTHWNRQTMSAVAEFYALREGGPADEAMSLRTGFFERCPSAWYRSVMAAQ
jgi:hypothetical protein